MGGSVTIGPAEPSLARPTGERRQVTVVFYDIVEFHGSPERRRP